MEIKKTLLIFFAIFIFIATINVYYLPSTRPSISSDPPVVEVEGGPYKMGRQHGMQAKEQIQTYASMIEIVTSIPGMNLGDFSEEYAATLENTAPSLLEEMKGIAEGAGVDNDFIFFLNGFLSMRCTSWGATGNATEDGSAILGKNRDFTYAAYKNQIILKANPENGNSFVAQTNAGLVGMDQFLNEEGIGAVNDMVASKGGNGGISTLLFFRLIAQNCSRMENVTNYLDNFSLSHGGNFLFAENSGQLLLIEAAAGKGNYEAVRPTENVMYRTNHYATQKMIPYEAPISSPSLQRKGEAMESSFQRKSSIERIVNLHKGNINVDVAESMNENHYPSKGSSSVCRHGEEEFEYSLNLKDMVLDMFFVDSGGTISSIVIKPNDGIFKVAMGHPCDTEFESYKVENSK